MMKFAPFSLDDWLSSHQYAEPPIEYDIGASTGPRWTLKELLELDGPDAVARFCELRLGYAPEQGSKALREAIAEMEGVEPGQVQVTTGGQEALMILFALASEPGANVIVPFPGYPPFSDMPAGLGLEVRHYHLRAANRFKLDPDEIESLADRNTRIIILNSPHNPTGSVLSEAEVECLHDFATARRIQLVVDQVYHPIYYGSPAPSAARFPGVNVVGDFSKALSMGGLRVGWIIEREPARLEEYRKLRTYFTVSNTPMGEALAVIALRHRDAVYGRVRDVADANLAHLEVFFHDHADLIDWVPPQGGTITFPWLKLDPDSRPLCEAAARAGVLLAPGDCYGMPSHFRIGFGAAREGFRQALARLSLVLTEQTRAAAS